MRSVHTTVCCSRARVAVGAVRRGGTRRPLLMSSPVDVACNANMAENSSSPQSCSGSSSSRCQRQQQRKHTRRRRRPLLAAALAFVAVWGASTCVCGARAADRLLLSGSGNGTEDEAASPSLAAMEDAPPCVTGAPSAASSGTALSTPAPSGRGCTQPPNARPTRHVAMGYRTSDGFMAAVAKQSMDARALARDVAKADKKKRGRRKNDE